MTTYLARGAAALLLSFSLVQENQTPAFRARVFTVPVHVTVVDSEGRPVQGLNSSDFQLFENGVRQQVRTFFEVQPSEISVDASVSRSENEFFPDETAAPIVDPSRPIPSDRIEPEIEDEVRFVVIFFDETLDPFLDSFSLKRAKVAADLFVDSINPEKDVVAVSWRNRVSEFTSNRERLHELITEARPRTHGVLGPGDSERQSGLGLSKESFSRGPAEVADRYAEALGLDVPSSPVASGRAGTGQRLNDTLPLSVANMVRENELLSRMFRADSYEGYLSIVSRMKGLKGRKIVLYFGKGVPDPTGDEKSLDFYDPRLVARVFNDAGFSVYSINPQGLVAGTSIGLPTPEVGAAMITSKLGRDVLANSSSYAVENWTGNQYLNRWAIDTGGFGFFTNDIRKAVRRVLAETSFYYVLAYQPLELDSVGNYRKIEVKLSRPDLELRHRGGYFATEPGTLELQDRTVLTAFLAPERFQAFPIMTEGRSSAESQLEVLVSFPFGAVEVARTSEGRYLQKITVSFAAFDSADRIIGFEEALFQLDLSESEWQELRQGNATVERTLDIERKRGGPKRLRVVAIVGQNRQIAAAVSDVQLADRSLK